MALLLNFTYLLIMFPFISCLVDQYTIIRTSTDPFSSDVDIFAIPESICRSSVSQCSMFNSAIPAHHCTCKCPPFAATFAWHNGSWSCVKNTEIRAKLGCKFKFQYEQDQDPFQILREKQTPLPIAVLPSKYCSIHVPSSKYYKCNGKWTGLELTSSPLRIIIKRKLSGSKHYEYSFWVKSVASIKGTLVSLRLKCPENAHSSCLVFKMEGEVSCPVSTLQTSSTPLVGRSTLFYSSTKSPGTDEREGSSSRSQNDALSSTAIAIVTTTTIIILVIIIAATIWFIIWKRKRGESLGVIDRLTRSGKGKSSKPDDNTYAEIHAHSHQGPRQTRTDAFTRGIINSGLESSPTNLHQHQDPLYEDAADLVLPNGQPITDGEGYSVPVDSPLYLELHSPQESMHDGKAKSDDKSKNVENERSHPSRGGGTEDLDSPWYDVLEDTNDKSIDDGGEVDWQQEPNRNSVERDSVEGSGLSNAAGCHPRLPKRRRRPPSPPRKGHKPSSDGDEDKKHGRMTLTPDRQDITDVHYDSGRHDLYQGLKEDERVMSVYEALDRTAASS